MGGGDESKCQKLQKLAEYRRKVDQLERELGLMAGEGNGADEQGVYEDQEAAREALMVAERIGAMSNVARAIAHEINNPLATCIGYLRRALQLARRLGSDELVEVLERLSRGTNRIKSIVAELQMLSEEIVGESERLDLAQVVERVGSLVPPEFRPQLEFDLDSVYVNLDRPRLYQIVYNMVMAHLLSGSGQSSDESVEVHCGPADEALAGLEVTGTTVPRMGMRTDLLAALRGESSTATIPLRLAHRLAVEVHAEWREEPIDGDRYRTAIFFERS